MVGDGSRDVRVGERRARRVPVLLVVVVLVALTLTGCQRAKAGTRCRTTDWGDDGAYVLQCRKGVWRRVMTHAEAAAALASIAKPQTPVWGELERPTTLGQPLLPNTADPYVMVDGGMSYVFGTTNFRHVPVKAVPDLTHQYTDSELYSQTADAMPAQPAWASQREIWAPTVGKLGGRYVMYFAAHRWNPPDPSNDQCIGRAFSSTPMGPYSPEGAPFWCPTKGALDPSLFRAADGSNWLLVAQGGSSTNIWTIRLDGAGKAISWPTALLTLLPRSWQEYFLEQPSMFFDGVDFWLAYSVGYWDRASYSTGLARCASPTGPCTQRTDGPWLRSIGDRVGPGALEFFVGPDGWARVAYTTYPAGNVNPVGQRSTHIRGFMSVPWPRLT